MCLSLQTSLLLSLVFIFSVISQPVDLGDRRIKLLLWLLLIILSVKHIESEYWFRGKDISLYDILLEKCLQAYLKEGLFYLSLQPSGFLFLLRSRSVVWVDS